LAATPIATEYGVVRLSRSRLCRLFDFPRIDFYRAHKVREKVRDAAIERGIRHVLSKHRCYGYRPVAKALRKPRSGYRGPLVNAKCVLRIMRIKGLLCKPPRRSRWRRSKSGIAPYPNLAAHMSPSRPNELWSADFTELTVRSTRVFIAVVVDEFARRCIGFNVHSSHSVDLTLPALRMALASRRPPLGFVHHSDQGSEYMAHDYTGLVEEHGGKVSASRRSTPTDNAACERFIKTLKYEELLNHAFTDIEEVRAIMPEIVARYNGSRLHSSLQYRSPAEFERMYHAALKSQP